MVLSETEKAMLDRGIIMIEGEVNRGMFERVRQSLVILETRGSPDVEVRITSGGGETRVSLIICDVLRRYKGKKVGTVYGFARSAAATILQGCDERVCLKHSVVLIHNVLVEEVSLDDLLDKRRLEKLKQLMLTDQKSLDKLLASRTGNTIAQVRAACKKSRDMNAEEALKFGLIDRIEK